MITGANQILVGTAVPVQTLLDSKTTVQTGALNTFWSAPKVVYAKVTGSGSVSATVNIYGNVEASTSTGVLVGTLSPSGTTTAVDSISVDAPWPYLYADLTAITGTITVSVGL